MEMTIESDTNVGNDIIEIPMEKQNHGTPSERLEWESKFDDILSVISSQNNLQKVWRRIKIKNWLNNILEKLHIRKRISISKETDVISATMQDIFLHLNKWDDDSIDDIEEMRKDRSIEGIRKQQPRIGCAHIKEVIGA